MRIESCYPFFEKILELICVAETVSPCHRSLLGCYGQFCRSLWRILLHKSGESTSKANEFDILRSVCGKMPKSPNFELNHRQKRVRLSWPGGWVSNSARESIFQMNVGLDFTTFKLGFLNISKYLARYGIQMHPSVTERRQQSGKKRVLCMWGQLITIIILSGGGSELINKVLMMERLPRRFNIVEHR